MIGADGVTSPLNLIVKDTYNDRKVKKAVNIILVI